MRLSNELAIRRSTRLIAGLPFRRSSELRIPRLGKLSRSRARRTARPPERVAAARRLYLAHMKRLVLMLAAGIAATTAIAQAVAAITIGEARYAAGVLEIRGETGKPYQPVRLDDRYTAESDSDGKFHFRVQYLPNDCSVTLTAEGERRVAFVRGCLPD